MKITTAELPQAGYQLQSELYHPELVQFLQNEMQDQTWVLRVFRIFNGLLFMGLAGYIGFKLAADWAHADRYMTQFGNGVLLVFLLVVPHELLHGLAYKLVGAPRVSYGANLKKLMFFAIADGFVANFKEFRLVALTPFVVISISFLASFLFAPSSWYFTIYTMLTAHTTFCSGDFGLLNYMLRFRDHGIVTVDFKNEKKSAFWIKERLNNKNPF